MRLRQVRELCALASTARGRSWRSARSVQLVGNRHVRRTAHVWSAHSFFKGRTSQLANSASSRLPI